MSFGCCLSSLPRLMLYPSAITSNWLQHLQAIFHRLEAVMGKVAHNVIWKLPPTSHAHLPWRIEILPRLTTFAGLELGSGLYVNPIRPELAASQLTNVLLPS